MDLPLSKVASCSSVIPPSRVSNILTQYGPSLLRNPKTFTARKCHLSSSKFYAAENITHPLLEWPEPKREFLTEARHHMTEARNRRRFPSTRNRFERLPTVIPLSERSLSAVLPASGTGEQVIQQLGGPATWLRRVVVSMAGAAVFYNINILLTIMAALYWAWSPMFSAAKCNALLRLKYKFAGVWRAKIVESRLTKAGQNTMLHVLIGDDSGTLVEMDVPAPSSAVAFTGDPVELLVLSDHPKFTRFRVLREVYLPEQQTWLAEQLFVERSVFEELSKEVALLILTVKQDEEQVDDWEGQCLLAADGLAQDVEQYRSYDRPQRRLSSSTLDSWHSTDFDTCSGYSSSTHDDFTVSCMACEGQEVEYFHDHCGSGE